MRRRRRRRPITETRPSSIRRQKRRQLLGATSHRRPADVSAALTTSRCNQLHSISHTIRHQLCNEPVLTLRLRCAAAISDARREQKKNAQICRRDAVVPVRFAESAVDRIPADAGGEHRRRQTQRSRCQGARSSDFEEPSFILARLQDRPSQVHLNRERRIS